ncbi:MAG: hypothetical protein HY293_03135, partial [Planctomycetes bacterium]|nr:hypothetical protein [Planctomycetota bacterium]
ATPTIALLPGESSAVQVLLSIDRYAPEAEVVFGAESDAGENDALALRLPGRRHASPFLEGRSGSVAGGTPREEVFRIPEDAIPGTIVLKFDFDAGIHTAISGAIDPLIEYPYGCVEQTMTRFLPAVAARRALGDLPPRLREKLPSVIAAGLQRLYALQNRDGSWGWWAAGPQNSPLTAYVLFGLSICKKAGVGVDRSVADLAAKRILERLGKSVFEGVVPGQGRLPMTHSLDPRIHELLALAEYHSAWNVPSLQLRQLIETMADRRDTLGPTDEIVLGLAAARLGLNDVAAPLAERAAKRIPDDVASASFLLQLQAARGGDLAPTVRFLLARRRGKGWANTIESAHAILGLAAAVERPSPAMDLPPGRVEVRVNGAFAQEILLKGTADAAFDGRYTIPAPAGGWGGKTVVRLSYDGQGAAYYTASLEASLGGEDRPPVSRGLEIRREYYERDSDGVGWHPVEGAIALGHTVLVVLRVETSGSRDYLMVSDPRPDGFEPLDFHVTSLNGRWTAVRGLSDRVDLERGWQGRLEEFQRTARGDAARESAWGKALLREIIEQRRFSAVGWGESVEFPSAAGITHVEHRDDRTIFFLDSLNPGAQCVWYLARAELPGRTHALAPRVEAMYEPALNASGSEARLEVADGRLIRSKPRTFSNAAGVNGLLELLPHLGTVDADALIHHIPGNPRIGELLVSVCTEPAIRAWLTAASATSAAGRSLRERIEAAREDLATRQLCVEALGGAPREWLPALDAALADDALARKVLEGSDPETRTAADNLLFWTQEDRDWRMGLFAAAQKLRGSARLSLERMPRLGFSRILEALGPEAPVGEELLRWKLAQRWKVSALSLEEFARRCERDLALKLRLKILGTEHVGECQGPVGSILDQVLLSLQLCYRVQGDEIWIGPPEELFR